MTMLDISKHLQKIQSHPDTLLKQAIEVISGLFVSKAFREYPVWRRAQDAIRWKAGEVTVEPTIGQACEFFRVSRYHFKQAEARLAEQCKRAERIERERLERLERIKCEHASFNGGGPTALSDNGLDNLIERVGIARVLAAVHRVTRPHPVAAE
jgi:hypothetical protein